MKVIFGTLVLLMSILQASSAFVTLTVSQATATQIVVSASEVVRIASFPSTTTGDSKLKVTKDGIEIYAKVASITDNAERIFTGPCIVSLSYINSGGSSCTLEITPNIYTPSQTLVIPAGTGARISLQCSTNLTTWTNIFSASYTNEPDHKFFRMALERTP